MFKDESDLEKIVGRLNIDAAPNSEHRESLREQMLSVFDKTSQKRITPLSVFRRTLMKSRITKLAAAAVILVAVLIGILQFGGSTPAFAEVIQPLLTARTAVYKLTVQSAGKPPETSEWMYKVESGTREVRPGGVIRILHHGQEIMLWPTGKKGLILKRINIPEEKDRQTNWFHEIKERIRQAQEAEEESVEFLGKQEIDGVMAFVYRIGENSKMTDMTVWADTETLLPVRIEHSIGSAGRVMNIEGTITYSDIIINAELDESLFAVPEGYDARTIEIDSSKVSEDDLIHTLHLWADNTDGEFPLELNIKAAGEFFQRIREKMGLKGLTFKEGETPEFAEPKFSEFFPIRQRIIRGLGFISKLPPESDWHYVGKDVKFGEAEKPIFWYKPEGSPTYRVLYGDLSIKNVKPENLPQ